uniref:Uncharacterized protein n=1 Tax=Ixodes ricinus TaxID=34613 RepID=A0A0K8RLJ5_IXORI
MTTCVIPYASLIIRNLFILLKRIHPHSVTCFPRCTGLSSPQVCVLHVYRFSAEQLGEQYSLLVSVTTDLTAVEFLRSPLDKHSKVCLRPENPVMLADPLGMACGDHIITWRPHVREY